MPRQRFVLSGYTTMVLFVLFDLPVKTKRDRKNYARFRKTLLEDGFSMIQYSVYIRFCLSEEIAGKHRRTVREALPPRGMVHMMTVTSRQFQKMENLVGAREKVPEREPDLATFY